MPLELPGSLSPSKVSRFTECALAFRFSAIDKIPEPPSAQAAKGTLLHSALERLFWELPQGSRSPEAARELLQDCWVAFASDPEFSSLELETDERDALLRDAGELLERYFRLENPDSVTVAGVELLLETEFEGVMLRGIIDRLDITPEGDLVVVDYKTGRVPSEMQEKSRLSGVHFYALLCERVLGRRPSLVRLMYLRGPLIIETAPSDQAIRGLTRRTEAVWKAIQRSCAEEDFRPHPGPLCDWCAFKDLCPAFGGDPKALTAGSDLSLAG